MPNYLIQRAPWMPAGSRFRIVKTQIDVSFDGYIVETDVGLAKPFATEYWPTRKKAKQRRNELVATSDEVIVGVVDFFYVTNQEVAKWLYESGQLIGIENYEAWFKTLTRLEQATHKRWPSKRRNSSPGEWRCHPSSRRNARTSTHTCHTFASAIWGRFSEWTGWSLQQSHNSFRPSGKRLRLSDCSRRNPIDR